MVHFYCTLARGCENSPSLSGSIQDAPVDRMFENIVEQTNRAVDYGTIGYFSEGPMLYTNENDQTCAKKDEETVYSARAGYVLGLPMVYEKKHNRTHANKTSNKDTSSPRRNHDKSPIKTPALKRRRTPGSEEDGDPAAKDDAVEQHLLPFESWVLNLKRHEYNLRSPLFEPSSPTEPPELFCSFCGVLHPAALFSAEEREKASGERMCHSVTGSIRVCDHLSVPMVDIWKWFDTGVALRHDGNGDHQLEPLVGACETCREWFDLDEFGAAARFARTPSVTVRPHDSEWFDVFSEVEVTWELPVFDSSRRDVADEIATENLLTWDLEELDRRHGRVVCVHVDRRDIVRAFGSEDPGGGECPRATECDACGAVYSWVRREDVEFLSMVSSGRLVKTDGGKRCFEGYRGLVESASSSSSPAGLPQHEMPLFGEWASNWFKD